VVDLFAVKIIAHEALKLEAYIIGKVEESDWRWIEYDS